MHLGRRVIEFFGLGFGLCACDLLFSGFVG